MMKQIAYISILLVWGCNSLVEKSVPLGGEFYIQDGWLAFSSKKYEEADKHFNTAIETNDSGSVFHFLSLVGLGWTHIYKARMIEETSTNGYVNNAGKNLNAANNLMLNMNIEEIIFDLNAVYFNGITDMYAGLVLQRSYFAKQKSANENAWETTNESLSDTVRILYEESIDFSIQLESDYIFQHDVELTYNDILVLRTENYLILGNIEKAILSFNQIDFDQLGFEVDETCEQGIDIDSSKLIECLCLVSHNGFCPFQDLIDECTLETDNCDANAICTNTDRSFTCTCNSGYSGDGTSCTDIDECTLETDNCDVNAACTNTDGSFTCACNSGYSGDGTSCTEND